MLTSKLLWNGIGYLVFVRVYLDGELIAAYKTETDGTIYSAEYFVQLENEQQKANIDRYATECTINNYGV